MQGVILHLIVILKLNEKISIISGSHDSFVFKL
jgi:hypothetical protein